jgi:hypothetical protein
MLPSAMFWTPLRAACTIWSWVRECLSKAGTEKHRGVIDHLRALEAAQPTIAAVRPNQVVFAVH